MKSTRKNHCVAKMHVYHANETKMQCWYALHRVRNVKIVFFLFFHFQWPNIAHVNLNIHPYRAHKGHRCLLFCFLIIIWWAKYNDITYYCTRSFSAPPVLRAFGAILCTSQCADFLTDFICGKIGADRNTFTDMWYHLWCVRYSW